MKQPVRYFSIGLFTASLIIFIIFLFTNTSNELDNISTEEMIKSIETDGYRVITEEDYITYTMKKDDAQKQEDKEEKDSKEKKQDKIEDDQTSKDKENDSSKSDEPTKKDSVNKYTLKVKSGMMPEEVAKLLEKNDIIDDAFSFATYLEDNGYSPYVQIDTYKVNSDMSRKDIAELITKNRRP